MVKKFEPPTVTRAADDTPMLIDFDYFVTKDDVRADFRSDTQGLLVPVPPVRRRLAKTGYRMLGEARKTVRAGIVKYLDDLNDWATTTQIHDAVWELYSVEMVGPGGDKKQSRGKFLQVLNSLVTKGTISAPKAGEVRQGKGGKPEKMWRTEKPEDALTESDEDQEEEPVMKSEPEEEPEFAVPAPPVRLKELETGLKVKESTRRAPTQRRPPTEDESSSSEEEGEPPRPWDKKPEDVSLPVEVPPEDPDKRPLRPWDRDRIIDMETGLPVEAEPMDPVDKVRSIIPWNTITDPLVTWIGEQDGWVDKDVAKDYLDQKYQDLVEAIINVHTGMAYGEFIFDGIVAMGKLVRKGDQYNVPYIESLSRFKESASSGPVGILGEQKQFEDDLRRAIKDAKRRLKKGFMLDWDALRLSFPGLSEDLFDRVRSESVIRDSFNQAPRDDRERSLSRMPEREIPRDLPDLSQARGPEFPDIQEIESDDDLILPHAEPGPVLGPVAEPEEKKKKGYNILGPVVVGLIFFYLASYAT